MESDLEKLLSALRHGRLADHEMRDIGDSLLKSLSPEQRAAFEDVVKSPESMRDFMQSPQVKKIMEDE